MGVKNHFVALGDEMIHTVKKLANQRDFYTTLLL